MAVTLAEAAVTAQDPRLPGVVGVLNTSNIMNRVPFENIAGRAFSYNSEATLPAAAFRAVNAGYTESTGTFNNATESLVILGGDYVVDRFLEQTSTGSVASLVAAQRDMKARSIAAKFSDTFINGSTGVDANSFNGLKTRITGGQVLSSGTNGAAMNTDAATRTAFLDRLDALLALVPGANALYANSQVIALLRTVFRNTTINNYTVDELTGRPVEVPTWQGIPILDAGLKADQTAVIPQTEVQGSSSVASSIYAVKFAASENDTGVLGITNGGLQVDPPRQLETKPSWLGRIEIYCGLAMLGAQPAARLSGVLAS
ncbi:major capsid protein [Nocardioides sp.]|uniref:major capsid protein n=1 Tax=Nocardioides sp. TaxID=35761 RepID=UPI00356AD03E